jgi:hypothetical protein
MTQDLIDQYNVELQDQKFLDLVASIYKQKLAGTYENIQLETVGGWYTSPEGQEIQKAERIADAIIKTGV